MEYAIGAVGGFFGGFVVGAIVAYLYLRKKPRGATISVDSPGCNGNLVHVTGIVNFDSGTTINRLFAVVFDDDPPTLALPAIAESIEFDGSSGDPYAIDVTSPGGFTGDDFVVVWAAEVVVHAERRSQAFAHCPTTSRPAKARL